MKTVRNQLAASFSNILGKTVRAAALGAAVAGTFAAPASAGFFDGYYSSYDGGGSVLGYFEQVRYANVTGQSMPIDGYCASACTMKLGARHACVRPDTILRFHSASAATGNMSSAGNTILMSVYPHAIREWVRRHRALDSTAMVTMTGYEAMSLGIRPC